MKFLPKTKAKSISSIVASIVKMRGELAQAITANRDDIVVAQNVINKAEKVKAEEIAKAKTKYSNIESAELTKQTEAEQNIKEAEGWLESLPTNE